MTTARPRASTSAIAQVYGKLPAQDVERARTFYAEKLGIVPFGERAQHLYYEIGGVNFIIYPSTGTASGTHDQLGLVVEDLEAEVARLKSLGVCFESYRERSGLWPLARRGLDPAPAAVSAGDQSPRPVRRRRGFWPRRPIR